MLKSTISFLLLPNFFFLFSFQLAPSVTTATQDINGRRLANVFLEERNEKRRPVYLSPPTVFPPFFFLLAETAAFWPSGFDQKEKGDVIKRLKIKEKKYGLLKVSSFFFFFLSFIIFSGLFPSLSPKQANNPGILQAAFPITGFLAT